MKNRYYINILSKTREVDSKKYREVRRVVLASKLGENPIYKDWKILRLIHP